MNNLKVFLLFLSTTIIFSQSYDFEINLSPNGEGWGYNYDSLAVDLDIWRNSPFVKIDSIGASVQNRALWQLTIPNNQSAFDPKYRITIHARTHPIEVYSFYTTRAIISILLGDSELGQKLRNRAIFNIIPIYNPDGVELGYNRENYNGVDLERDWDKLNPQPESAALKALYKSYMESDFPIDIMLNMHNAGGNINRYFVYHDATGTSQKFAEIQQEFIGLVRSYWEDGFEEYDYFVSWINNTPTHYPESWFWLNYGEEVIALTYEDTQTSSGNDFHRAAEALLIGISVYLDVLEISTEADSESNIINSFELFSAYPNPFNPSTNIRYRLYINTKVTMKIYDITGNLITTLLNGQQEQGWHTVEWNGTNQQGLQVPAGVYFCQLTANDEIQTNKLNLLR